MQNIIEHAVITSRDEWLYPEVPAEHRAASEPLRQVEASQPAIMTADEIRDLQRLNIVRALASCNGRISGAQGAAAVLKMNPSTLRSQMRALDIDHMES